MWNSKPEDYYIYRYAEKRDINDICDREFKNAICLAIQEKGTMTADDLLIQEKSPQQRSLTYAVRLLYFPEFPGAPRTRM